MKLLGLTAALFVFLGAGAGLAQGVNARQETQQQRVTQGERSGELTRPETRAINSQRATTRRLERRMRARHHGRLTRADRRRLDSRLDRQNRMIHRMKHNGRSRALHCTYRGGRRFCRR